jgi:hypothetical protein
MPRIDPEELMKQKLARLEREREEEEQKNVQKVVQNNALKNEQINAQISVQKNERELAQSNAQKSARIIEQESVQNNSSDVVNVDNSKQLNQKEKSRNISSATSNDDENVDLVAKLQKLADKISLSDVQSELFRDRTILPRTSYTLSDEIVEVINSFYLVLKKKDKRLSKQDAAEIILRQFFKDCLKVSKPKNIT